MQAVPCDNRPFPPAVDLWWALEIRLTEWIKEMHGLRKPVIRILVIKKALEFAPDFMGGLLAPQFMKSALSWYYRVISRGQNHRSIQKPTSIGQILPDGWQEMWRSCVKEVLALRRNPEIVEAFNRQRPHEMPVEILPV